MSAATGSHSMLAGPPVASAWIAPIMMIASPAAAMGVNRVAMRSTLGRISPIAPRNSHNPTNGKNSDPPPCSAAGAIANFDQPVYR